MSFQFTQPKRAATRIQSKNHNLLRSFNSRSPSGLRLTGFVHSGCFACVSIHAAQAGCDWCASSAVSALTQFQFTQPKRAATGDWNEDVQAAAFQFTQPKRAATFGKAAKQAKSMVSIHAAQAGCDIQNKEYL